MTDFCAGELRHYGDIHSKVIFGVLASEQGAANVGDNLLYANVPMRIEDLDGRKLELARQLVADCSHRITMRYHPNLNEKCWIMYQGRRLNVGKVLQPEEITRWQILICTEEKQRQ